MEETEVLTKNKPEIIPNEVIVVGKLKNEDDTTKIPKELKGDELKTALRDKFKFTRNTVITDAGKEVNQVSGQFFHIQIGDPGGENILLKNGTTVKRSRRTTNPGYDVVFKRNRQTIFDDISTEIKLGNFDIVGGDQNSGKIRLTQYALLGFWDVFPTGFWYFRKWYDPKQGGKLVPFLTYPKKDDGSYPKEGIPAQSNMSQHFVYEDEMINLEGLRNKVRDLVRKYKVPNTEHPTDDGKTGGENAEPADKKIETIIDTNDEP